MGRCHDGRSGFGNGVHFDGRCGAHGWTVNHAAAGEEDVKNMESLVGNLMFYVK